MSFGKFLGNVFKALSPAALVASILKPKKPDLPNMPTAPTQEDAAVAAEKERQRLRSQGGYNSTLMGGLMSGGSSAPTPGGFASKQLLGG